MFVTLIFLLSLIQLLTSVVEVTLCSVGSLLRTGYSGLISVDLGRSVLGGLGSVIDLTVNRSGSFSQLLLLVGRLAVLNSGDLVVNLLVSGVVFGLQLRVGRVVCCLGVVNSRLVLSVFGTGFGLLLRRRNNVLGSFGQGLVVGRLLVSNGLAVTSVFGVSCRLGRGVDLRRAGR